MTLLTTFNPVPLVTAGFLLAFGIALTLLDLLNSVARLEWAEMFGDEP